MNKRLRLKSALVPADIHTFLKQTSALAAGLTLSAARLFGGASPFAAALAAACPTSVGFTVLAGCISGYLLQYDGAWTARMLAAVIGTGTINLITRKNRFIKHSAYVAPINAAVCMLLTGLTVMLAQGFDINGLMLYVCESVIAAGAAATLETAFTAVPLFSRKEPLPQKQLVCVTVSLCIILMSLEKLQLEGISLARAVAVFAVLCASKWLGTTGGCVCGGAMGFAMSIGSSFPFLGGAYTFGGLVSGLFSPVGRFAQAFAYAVCSAVAVLMNTGTADLMPPLYETAIATVAFVLIPEKFFTAASVYFVGRQTLPEFETMKKAMLLRLESVKSGLEEVSDALEQIARNMIRLDKNNESPLSEEIKQLVRDQFSTLALAVGDISDRFCGETRFDTVTASKIAFVLENYGIKPVEIICSETSGISRIEISAQKLKGKFSRSALMSDMESACGYKLSNPTVREEKDKTMLTFVRKPRMNIVVGKAQFSADESAMCGDTCDCFPDKDGNQIIVISDGMGTGPRAAVDGAVAAWLFAKLLVAGLNFDSSLRLSNSALIVKSQEETVATIDAAKINLHTGEAQLFKAGAGVSLVCRGRKVYQYGKPSMPLGILREIEFDKETVSLSKGDILLMMSDGVSSACYGLIADELRKSNRKDPSALAERVVEIAKNSGSGRHLDDITAVAVIVS
ncbi:MAG: SpoIIE family protein phosphatase [Clostridia bacterium]|nr:SpoIIE family protein phosphatase [Clostridia bacterium]